MAAAKRRLVAQDVPSQNKRPKQELNTRKISMGATSKPKSADTEENSAPRTKQISILSKDQAPFPRGGAGLLTPLERKQIRAKASLDADQDLFNSQRADGFDDSDEGQEAQGTTEAPPKKSKTGSKKRPASDTPDVIKRGLRIEGLTYKRLAIGSLVLGQVTGVSSRDLTVSLPNNLVGYVPLTSISSQVNEKIQVLLDKDTSAELDIADNAEPEAEEDDIALRDYVSIGQYLRVSVTSTGEGMANQKSLSKKRIELSIEPRLANSGLSVSSIVPGCMVQVSVSSLEDHGLAVQVDLDDAQVRGFIPTKNLSSSTLESTKVGSVLLCEVLSIGSSGKVLKLSTKCGSSKTLKNAPTVDAFLPGTMVEALVTEKTESGMAGKVMGMLDVTADIVHSGSCRDKEQFMEGYTLGARVKGRLLYNFPLSEDKKLGFSILENVVDLSHPLPIPGVDGKPLGISSTIRKATVTRVEPGLGVYLQVQTAEFGFAHISRLSDNKVDSISETTGPYKLGTQHDVRVLEHSPIDNLFIVSLQKSVLEQLFLRLEDIPIGQVVQGSIEKILVGPTGIDGLIVKVGEHINGLVPQIHLSDIALQHPEKKFREGQLVNARVLSRDVERRRLRLTLKKSLVNSDQAVWEDFNAIKVGDSTIATLVKVETHGALVRFFGSVKGFLPVSEMSEAYIKDAKEHFRNGQTVTVHAISVNPEERRLILSCRDSSAVSSGQLGTSPVTVGSIITGVVFEKSEDDLLLRLDDSKAIGRLTLDHVADGSLKKRQSVLAKIRVGQRLEDVLVLEVQPKRQMIVLSNKQSLVKATKDGTLLSNFEQLKKGNTVGGFVSNIGEAGVFVRFAGGITGLLTKNQVPAVAENEVDFGMHALQPITARVLSIDYHGATPRFLLTMRDSIITDKEPDLNKNGTPTLQRQITDPVDESIGSEEDLVVGRIVKARITSVKDTQLNVELAKDIQGRVDVSEVFDSWDDIADRKRPLRSFSTKEIITTRIIGAHDSRTHKFLPLTHRAGKNIVYELTAKPSALRDEAYEGPIFANIQEGSSWLAFVNNMGVDHLWLNISPRVRGRMRAVDAADDLTLTNDLISNFAIGSAMRVRVVSIDPQKERLDLSARSGALKQMTFDDVTADEILPGRVTKVNDRQVIVQLSDTVAGVVELVDLADDFAEADTSRYSKNDTVRVRVLRVDKSNKKIFLSTRHSKVLSSSSKVTDPEITDISQLKVNDIYRGFISNVSDKGLFVTLGHSVTAFVRISNLSDDYLKEWKDHFQRDQLVRGKIIALDQDSRHVQMSLKRSVLDSNYKAPRKFVDMHVGDVVTAKVVKVEPFGVFLLVDNTENVRGLCHRSEMAEKKIEDVSKIYNEGDAVKAKIIKVSLSERRINFSLKASHFADGQDDAEEEVSPEEFVQDGEVESEDGEVTEGMQLGSDDSKIDEINDEDVEDFEISGPSEEDDVLVDEEGIDGATKAPNLPSVIDSGPTATGGLKVGGFDWYGMTTSTTGKRSAYVSDTDDEKPTKRPKKKSKKSQPQPDLTGELDQEPRSAEDFERMLQYESSVLTWLQYIAFHLELGDVGTARQIGERALKSMGTAMEQEKLDIWVALLNLENVYGDDDSIEATFQRACEYNDPQEIHSRLTSIFIQSGKQQKAEELFQRMIKKFKQDPKVWITTATFFFDVVGDAEKARALLPQALRTLPKFTHFDITSKFAQLEFKSQAGLPERGRTIFEGLISSFPKRVDLFNILLDLELKLGDEEQIRGLFERIFTGKLRPKQAKYFFKRWLEYAEAKGDGTQVERVKAKAEEYRSQHLKGES